MGEFRYVGTAALEAMALRACTVAVQKAQHDLLAGAQPLTHVDTGAERAGIHANPVKVSGTSVTGSVESSMEYDIYQHEGWNAGGGMHVPGTHFLEKPLIEGRAAFLAAVAQAGRAEF